MVPSICAPSQSRQPRRCRNMAGLSGFARAPEDDRDPCFPSNTRRKVVRAARPMIMRTPWAPASATLPVTNASRDTARLGQDPRQGRRVIAGTRQPEAIHRQGRGEPVHDRLTDTVNQRVVEPRDTLLHPIPQPLLAVAMPRTRCRPANLRVPRYRSIKNDTEGAYSDRRCGKQYRQAVAAGFVSASVDVGRDHSRAPVAGDGRHRAASPLHRRAWCGTFRQARRCGGPWHRRPVGSGLSGRGPHRCRARQTVLRRSLGICSLTQASVRIKKQMTKRYSCETSRYN